MGVKSVEMVKMPSKGESSYGFTIEAETWARTLA
jgi:hypothetical protein